MPPNLLIVSNFYPPAIVGGAELVAHRHARLLKGLGWNVKVFCGAQPSVVHRSGSLTVNSVDGIEVISLAHRSLEPADNFRWPLANRVLRSILSSYEPDLVHFHNVMGLGADLIRIAEEAGVRTAVTLHDHWGYCFKNTRLREGGSICHDVAECHLCKATIDHSVESVPIRLRRDYVLSRLDKADILISPSEYLADCYRDAELGLGPVVVQSNGVNLGDIPFRLRKPKERIAFLCAAYLGEHKGIPVLLEAIRLLERRSELKGRWSLTIAGHGHLKDTVEAFLGGLSSAAHVKFSGRLNRDAMMRALDSTDVVVLPSVYPENEPVILLEGVATGAAIIATAVGGNPHIVKDDTSGLTVPPGNAQALADVMERLIRTPAVVTAMSQHNLARRESLDETASVDRLVALFDRPLPQRRRRSDIIICAGHPDLEVSQVLATLAKVMDGPPFRLIWQEWAEPTDWASAKGFWCWNRPAEIKDVSEALNWDLPLILPESRFSRSVRQLGRKVEAYRDWAELWQALAGLCVDGTRKRQVSLQGLLRFAMRLQPMEDFSLMVAE